MALNSIDKIKTRWAAVQTLVSGGVESDFRYYVFGNYIDEVFIVLVQPELDKLPFRLSEYSCLRQGVF